MDLRPFFVSDRADVKEFFGNCVEAGANQTGGIDFSMDQFTTQDLYTYLYDADKRVRDLGIQIIILKR